MCGILSVYNHNKEVSVGGLANIVYQNQKTRGRDGFGFVEVLDEELKFNRFVFEDDAVNKLKESKSNLILFHHRIPTSTNNVPKCNHPIFTDNELYKHNYFLIHNGHIGNCVELKKEHEKYGIKYNTEDGDKFTDSESLLHEVALIIEGINKPTEFAANGGMAFIIMQTDKFNNPIALYYGRSYSNPLKIQQTSDAIVLRSECQTGEIVETNKLFRYDLATKLITSEDVMFGKLFVFNKLTSKDILYDALCDLYENNYILRSNIDKLTNDELNKLFITAQKLISKLIMEYEKKLLSSPLVDLISLRNHCDSVMRTINYIKTKLTK